MLGYQTMKIIKYTCQFKTQVLRESTQKSIFIYKCHKFHYWRKNTCNMRVSMSPFLSRERTPLQRCVSSLHGQAKIYKYLFLFSMLWSDLTGVPTHELLATCHNSKFKNTGEMQLILCPNKATAILGHNLL
jgi:hypothetical protein